MAPTEPNPDANEKSAAERLAELTGEPKKFEYDGPIPDAEDLEWERVDE